MPPRGISTTINSARQTPKIGTHLVPGIGTLNINIALINMYKEKASCPSLSLATAPDRSCRWLKGSGTPLCGYSTWASPLFGLILPVNGLTPLEPQSRFGDKLLDIRLVCPQNGTAVLKGSSCTCTQEGLFPLCQERKLLRANSPACYV